MSKFKYLVKINGRRALNGPLFGVQLNGEVDDNGLGLHQTVRELAMHVEDEADKERMEFPEAIQITVTSK